MSLKIFHIVFITLSTLLALGCGVGALAAYADRPSGTLLAVAIGAFAAAVAMLIYGVWFLRKAKKLIT